MTTQNQPFDVLVVDDDPSIYDLLHMVGQREFSEATFRTIASSGLIRYRFSSGKGWD